MVRERYEPVDLLALTQHDDGDDSDQLAFPLMLVTAASASAWSSTCASGLSHLLSQAARLAWSARSLHSPVARLAAVVHRSSHGVPRPLPAAAPPARAGLSPRPPSPVAQVGGLLSPLSADGGSDPAGGRAGPAVYPRRQARAEQCARHLRSTGQAGAVATDDIWCLLTTEATWPAAVTHDSGRFSTERNDRDIKSWGWEAVVGREPDPAVVMG